MEILLCVTKWQAFAWSQLGHPCHCIMQFRRCCPELLFQSSLTCSPVISPTVIKVAYKSCVGVTTAPQKCTSRDASFEGINTRIRLLHTTTLRLRKAKHNWAITVSAFGERFESLFSVSLNYRRTFYRCAEPVYSCSAARLSTQCHQHTLSYILLQGVSRVRIEPTDSVWSVNQLLQIVWEGNSHWDVHLGENWGASIFFRGGLVQTSNLLHRTQSQSVSTRNDLIQVIPEPTIGGSSRWPKSCCNRLNRVQRTMVSFLFNESIWPALSMPWNGPLKPKSSITSLGPCKVWMCFREPS